jgi:hypothetical protein
MRRPMLVVVLLSALLLALPLWIALVKAQPPVPVSSVQRTPAYDIGNPNFTDIYASPNGSDEQGDGSLGNPFRTIRRAWRAVEHGLDDYRLQAYRIRLLPGDYVGAYLDRETDAQFSRGTPDTPLVIESADPANRARVIYDPDASRGNLTLFKIEYAYLLNFDIRMDQTYGGVAWSGNSGDGFQCDQCSYLLLRGMLIRGYYNNDLSQELGQTETVKLNQAQHIYIEDSEIGGAGDNAIDAVAVRHGWWVRNRIHSARDWCAYAKGGSADILVAANELFNCGTGGFMAGQGTTMVFLRAPFLQYEAYHIKVLNNLIHDVRGAGLGVNGGVNILMAYNTLYRVGNDGNRNQMLELAPGARDCNGPLPADCSALLAQGAWGTALPGANGEFVPNRNVFMLNNLVYNPNGFRDPMRVFRLDGPRAGDRTTWPNGPLPARSDEGVVIAGNLIWTGTSGATDLGLGDGTGCQPDNPTCNPTQINADNRINQFEPALVNPSGGDYRPLSGGNLSGVTPVPLPTFDTSVLLPAQVPLVQLVNPLATTILDDYAGTSRATGNVVGALIMPPILNQRVYLPLVRR